MPGTLFTLTVLAALLFLVAVTTPLIAEEARPCAEDIAKFCKDVRPGGGRIISCLKSHEVELSSVCKDKLQEVLKKIDTAKRACTPDIEKFCRGIEEGEGRILRCLEQRASELSPACAEQLELAKAKFKEK